MAKSLQRDFFFGNGLPWRAFIYLRQTSKKKTILTLTDLEHKVIVSYGSGCLEGSKKYKRSALAVEALYTKLHFFLEFYKITGLFLVLRMRVSGPVFAFAKACSAKGVRIFGILERYNLAHNGVRRKRAPRK